MSNKTKIVVILGPTATGKSDLAVFLAKEFGGEVISADSRQVYKGLNIGTGKITKKEMSSIIHHLLDVSSLKKIFSISLWKEKAEKAIKEIIQKNKLPIICGGTGFYISSIVNNTSLPEVPPDYKLREKLDKKSTEELFKILEKLDKERSENIDSKNRVRIIRAIEIVKSIGKIPSLKTKDSPYDFLQIGLDLEDDKLKEKIENRLKKRIKIGMIAEAKRLHSRGLSFKRMYTLGLEYRFLADFLQNKITKEEFYAKLKIAIWHYAKRQRTWFRRDKNIKWFKPDQKIKILKEVEKFLKEKTP
jgi:tRNA dimethylallyltransferase